MMKRSLVLIAFIGISTISLFAQTRPAGDFSGTWVLDEDKTFSRDVDKAAFKDYVMEISENSHSFLIHVRYMISDRSVSYELMLYKDGRGEENSSPGGLRQTSITTVKDRKIISKYKYDSKPPLFGTDEYKLSKDHTKLVRERLRSSLDNSPWSNIPAIAENMPPNLPLTLVFRRKA